MTNRGKNDPHGSDAEGAVEPGRITFGAPPPPEIESDEFPSGDDWDWSMFSDSTPTPAPAPATRIVRTARAANQDTPDPADESGFRPLADAADEPDLIPQPRAVVLPSYLARAAQRWNPDSATRSPAPSMQPPPDEVGPIGLSIPIPQPAQPPSAKRRPEATYPAPLRPPEANEAPKRLFTPLPPPGYRPPPPPPPAIVSPLVDEAPGGKPLLLIQINSRPLFQGNGLMRGLFWGCFIGVAIGGVAAVLLDLIAPRPAPPILPPKVLSAEVKPVASEEAAQPRTAKSKPARPGARVEKGLAATSRRSESYDAPTPSITIQNAPPPRVVLRPSDNQ